MALATNTPRTFEEGDINEYGIVASEAIYEGGALGINASGDVGSITSTRSIFIGFALHGMSLQSVAALRNARVRAKGLVYLPITSVVKTDQGKDVYATDDGTFNLTGGYRIGRVYRFVSAGYAVVEFDAAGDQVRKGNLALDIITLSFAAASNCSQSITTTIGESAQILGFYFLSGAMSATMSALPLNLYQSGASLIATLRTALTVSDTLVAKVVTIKL